MKILIVFTIMYTVVFMLYIYKTSIEVPTSETCIRTSSNSVMKCTVRDIDGNILKIYYK